MLLTGSVMPGATAATAGALPPHAPLSYTSSSSSSTTTTATANQDVVVAQPLDAIQDRLKEGWTVHTAKDGRLYYCNHITKTAGWLPPIENWSPYFQLPYGWEKAVDFKGQVYYINHLDKTTTYEVPDRCDPNEAPPEPRIVTLQRSSTLGFGFVAGSERPVIVRFVTEGGPSVEKLLPGDQILEVNGEDVKEAPRDHVIQLVRNCDESVTLVVCQPQLATTVGRKSTLLSAGKKAKLKSKRIRVRFAESVCVNGAPLFPPSAFSLGDICVPPMANVLKVFLENGQTKSFKYDSTTTVEDVMTSLRDKLCISAVEHFSLVVEHVKSLKRNKLTLLDPQETVGRIAARPGAHKLRCLFRITFVPVTSAELAEKDLNALDYLFMQCCNDVIQERFAPELQPDVALRLAALHIHQHALANNISPAKLTVKTVEREFGLERFVPTSLIESMKRKELRRLIAHFLKLNSQMTGNSTKILTQLQAKIHYLDIISGLPSYGAKCFSTNQRDGIDRVLLVSPRFGLSQIAGIKSSVPQPICTIEELSKVSVNKIDEISDAVAVYIAPDRLITFPMEDREASEFVIVLAGYFHLLTGKFLAVDQERETQIEDIPPPYVSQHIILSAEWSYFPFPTEKPTHSMAFLMPPPYHSTRQILNSFGDVNMNSAITTNQNHDPPVYKDKDALRRVVEMQRMVESSEQYLNEQSTGDFMSGDYEIKPTMQNQVWRESSVDFESDCDSVTSSKQSSNDSATAPLKHSDSLTILTDQINNDLNGIERDLNSILCPFYDQNQTPRKVQGFSQIISDLQSLGHDLSLSESDTESIYTPASSPARGVVKQNNQKNKMIRASFGLHSPDTFPTPEPNSTQLREYLKKLKDASEKESHNSTAQKIAEIYGVREDAIVNDPDLIDLTSIPPPQTPDELDALKTIPGPPRGFDDKKENLEEFLKQVTIVPPTQKATPAVELTPEEILSYIIPPPPMSESSEHLYSNQSENSQPEKVPECESPSHHTNNVIEYPTLDRKPFLCCGKMATTPSSNDDEGGFLQPPPRRAALSTTPQRPPKNFEARKKLFPSHYIPQPPPSSMNGHNSDPTMPPSLPPRIDVAMSPPPILSQLPKKPPLPPLKPIIKSPTPIIRSTSTKVATIGSPHLHKNPNTYNDIDRAFNFSRDEIDHCNGHNRSRSDCSPHHHQPLSLFSPQLIRKKLITPPASPLLGRNGTVAETLLAKTDFAMTGLQAKLDQIAAACSQAQAAGGGIAIDEKKFQTARDELTDQALHLVTSSKLLVVAMSDPQTNALPEHLTACLTSLRRITELGQVMTHHTSSPLQTRNIILKIHDVATSFRELACVKVGSGATPGELALHAECLANVLATLLRSLRLFSP